MTDGVITFYDSLMLTAAFGGICAILMYLVGYYRGINRGRDLPDQTSFTFDENQELLIKSLRNETDWLRGQLERLIPGRKSVVVGSYTEPTIPVTENDE